MKKDGRVHLSSSPVFVADEPTVSEFSKEMKQKPTRESPAAKPNSEIVSHSLHVLLFSTHR